MVYSSKINSTYFFVLSLCHVFLHLPQFIFNDCLCHFHMQSAVQCFERIEPIARAHHNSFFYKFNCSKHFQRARHKAKARRCNKSLQSILIKFNILCSFLRVAQQIFVTLLWIHFESPWKLDIHIFGGFFIGSVQFLLNSNFRMNVTNIYKLILPFYNR